MNIIIIGHIGTDGGYTTIENGHVVHHGGWGVDSLVELNSALSILSQAARLKTPGLADAVSRTIGEFVQKEFGTHLGEQLKGGAVVVLNAG